MPTMVRRVRSTSMVSPTIDRPPNADCHNSCGQHRHRRSVDVSLHPLEPASVRGGHHERAQQMMIDGDRLDAPRPIRRRDVHFAGTIGAHRRERAIELAELHILGRRDPEFIEAHGRDARGDPHQLFGPRVVERLQQHAVDHREDRGVGAGAKRERGNGHRREQRMPAQGADGVPRVSGKVFERRNAALVAQRIHRARVLRRSIRHASGIPWRLTGCQMETGE